ncbi:restriction endonuclease [Pantoea agglomerans]|uniref:restriction endonuclease n=1 Tax=Enterobacter agglomerans TaxID=549 RepID=UPI0013039A3A|nr:restriction endonuclease [Pantoea agglomerans]
MGTPQIVALLLSVNPLLAAGLVVLLIVVAWLFRRETATARRHRRYRATAARVHQRLRELNGDGQRMSYLRKINPYVFEELLLLAFELQGLKVERNASYSGDGGLDGKVFINGECWLIQAKRYSRAISPSHVRDFDALLSRAGQRGFFIHTGRTGQMSQAVCRTSSRLKIISGQNLLRLLSGISLKEWSHE